MALLNIISEEENTYDFSIHNKLPPLHLHDASKTTMKIVKENTVCQAKYPSVTSNRIGKFRSMI